MGITRTGIQILLQEAAQRPFHGSVATLGRQHIYFRWEEFQKFASAASVFIPRDIVPRLHREPKLSHRGFASDDTILAGLGFSDIVRIDYSNFEDVEELFDLNLSETPPHLQNRFDTILDIGTLEHIFHTPNFLSNLHRMLKPGGRIIHLTPAANFMDHGFYSVSPTLFADYYKANQYIIRQMFVCRLTSKSNVNSPVELYDYLKRGNHAFEVGSLDDRTYNTWSVVQRDIQSTCGVVPQQSVYVGEWDAFQSTVEGSGGKAEPEGTKADRLLRLTENWPPAHRFSRWLIQTWRNALNSYRRRFSFPLPKWREYR